MANELWACCLCGLEKHPYGTLPCGDTCPNRKNAHITGKWYLAPNDSDGKPAIGIAAISDEGVNDGE